MACQRSPDEMIHCGGGTMVVLKEGMFGGLYRLIGNVQLGRAMGRAFANDSREKEVARGSCWHLLLGCKWW